MLLEMKEVIEIYSTLLIISHINYILSRWFYNCGYL